MKTQISLALLNEQSATVLTTKIVEDAGEEFCTPPHAKAYINSAEGREELKAEVPEPFLSAVLAAWGDTPTLAFEFSESDLENEG